MTSPNFPGDKNLPSLPPIPGVRPVTPSTAGGKSSLPPLPQFPGSKPSPVADKPLPSVPSLPKTTQQPVYPAPLPASTPKVQSEENVSEQREETQFTRPEVTPGWKRPEPVISVDDDEADSDVTEYREPAQPSRPVVKPAAKTAKTKAKRADKKTVFDKGSEAEKKAKSRPGKPQKPAAFDGGRKKVLYARWGIYALAGLLIIAGIFSFLPKASVLTAADRQTILSSVRGELGITEFPQARGESIALAFTGTYLNYNPENREQRTANLSQFVPKKVLETIDARPASQDELLAAGLPGDSAPSQRVTDGPYVVKTSVIRGGEEAIITTLTEINDNKWLAMEVPLFYDQVTRQLSVSGSPTFVNSAQAGEVPVDLHIPTWQNDDTVVEAMNGGEDIEAFLRAWAASNTVEIDRFLVKENGEVTSSFESQAGLGDEVTLLSISDFKVEAKERPESGDLTDFHTREARVTARWLDKSTGMTYAQTYQMTLQYVNENWFLKDIRSLATDAREVRENIS